MSYSRALSLALLLATPALAQEKQKHMVRFSFEPGAVRHSVITQNMTMAMTMGGQDMTTKMKMTMFTTTTLKSAEGNVATIEQHITRVKAHADSTMMKVDYDSADEDSDPGMLKGIVDLAGTKSTMKLTDQGKMSEVKLPESADVIKSAGVDLEQVMSQMVTQLPDEPIAIGGTWKVKQKLPLGQMGDVETEIVYKLIAVNKQFITLEQTMAMNMADIDMPGGMKVETMKAKGTSKLDIRTGMPIELTNKTTIKMAGQISMSMQIQQTIKPAPAPAKKAAKDAGKKATETKDAGK